MAEQLTTTRFFRLGGIFLLLAFGILYALTIDTGLQPYELHGGDLITHQYAQVQARPSNAPGYPLYTMGGWLWFHGWRALFHLFGQSTPNPTPILSSYSTLWALLALWLFYLGLGELHGKMQGKMRHVAYATLFCWALAAFYGVTYFFWYYATTTEQYSSAIAQTLAIVYLYLQWDKQPSNRALLYALALVCGISLAHMLTVAFIVPPLVALVLWRDPSLLRSPRAIALSIIVATLPLLSYIYVYVRGALNPNWWGRGHWNTAQEWFWWFVSTPQGRDELAWAFEAGRPFFSNDFPEAIWQELSLSLFLLGLVGIARLPRRHALMLYATLVIYAIFCWLYRFGNWFQVILPAYPLILLGIVPMFAELFQRDSSAARIGRGLLFVALLFTIGWRVNASLPAADSRNRAEDTALDRAAVLLDQPLPRDGRVFAAVDDALAISYLTEIWSIRPDIKTVSSRDADDDLSEGATIFATVDATPALLAELTTSPLINGFSPDWVMLSLVPVQVAPLSYDTAPPNHVTPYTVSSDLILAAYSVQAAPTGAPLSPPVEAGLDVRLVWHLPTGVWPQNHAISVRPTVQSQPMLDSTTSEPIQLDRPRPIDGLWTDYPSAQTTTNPIVVVDTYRLPQSPMPSAQVNGLLVILYTQDENGFNNIAEIALPIPEN